MCGIAGIFRRDGATVDAALIRRMTDTMVHRGPDDSGVWVDGAIGLGHRRLSILDLSAAGRQPMADPAGQVYVSYNGEIYNYPELRKELEVDFGFTFRSHSDTELLPLGYLAWGDSLIDRLEGMFAIALWDCRAKRLLLARDGIGIKPIYYSADARRVAFGSELKAVLAAGDIAKQLAPEALHTYLAAGFSGPGSSLVQGVEQVRPGTILTFTAHNVSERIFWRPTRRPDIASLDQALDEFLPLLRTVVQSQLASDVPLSMLQSGGIDSTLVSLSVKSLETSPPLFTAGFDDKSHDETSLARQVASSAGLSLHIFPVDQDSDPVGSFRAITQHFDGQCADTGAYAFYRLCGEVRKHTTVVLSGDGGDEFFAGYSTYGASQAADKLCPWLPSGVLGFLGRRAYAMGSNNETRLPPSALFARFALGLSAGKRHAHMQWRRLVPEFLLPSLYNGPMLAMLGKTPYSEYEQCSAEKPSTRFDQWLLADQRFHLQSVLAKVDAMSMAHSLEVRVPLLDRRIMDFAARCSTNLLMPKGGPTKYLLRQAAQKLGAPDSVLQAKKKGFNVPIAKMLRNELRVLGDFWFESNPDVLEPYFKPEGLRSLWRSHVQAMANHAFALWPLLMLAEWTGNSSGG